MLPRSRVITALCLCVFCLFSFYSCNLPQTPQDSIDTMIQSHADALQQFSQTLKKTKVIAISDIANYTGESIDIQSLIAKLKLHLASNSKFIFSSAVGGSGAHIDTMITKSRKLRQNEEFNPYTTKEKGELLAPDYSLTGKITKNGAGYEFLLVLNDLSKGVEVWSNIAKFHKLPKMDTKVFKELGDELFEKCAKGNHNACEEMSQMFDTLIATDSKTQKKLRECKKEECLAVGVFYSLMSRDDEAIKFIQKAINTGYNEFSKIGVYSILSSVYRYRYENNEQKATYYAKLGCDNKEYEACALLGETHFNNEEYKESKKYFQIACDNAKHIEFKAHSCEYLGILYYNGLGIQKDIKKGLSYIEDACHLDYIEACGKLKNLYTFGDKDTKENADLANKFEKKICDLGDKNACERIKQNQYFQANYPKCRDGDKTLCKEMTQQQFFKILKQNCEFENISSACDIVGQIYYFANEMQYAKPYCKKACDNGVYMSCLFLAEIYGIFEKNYSNGAKYYEIVCNKANGFVKGAACGYLGSYYAMGLGVRQDWKKFVSLIKISCQSGASIGCVSLASIYESGGHGIKQNLHTAKEYYGKACDLGNLGYEEGCARYKMLNERGVR